MSGDISPSVNDHKMLMYHIKLLDTWRVVLSYFGHYKTPGMQGAIVDSVF